MMDLFAANSEGRALAQSCVDRLATLFGAPKPESKLNEQQTLLVLLRALMFCAMGWHVLRLSF